MSNSELFSLKGKVAIVTGALGLIGQNHCKALAEAGAGLVVADINEAKCIKYAEELGNESIGVRLDVTDKNSIEDVKIKIIEKLGRIDILVNNAAINDMFENPKAAHDRSKFENYPLEMWQRSVDVNLTGVFLCSQVFGSIMAEQGKGSIINIASTYGIVGPNQSLYIDENRIRVFYKPPAYSATKGGVISFTKYLAAYWGHRGVRVNTLSPGGVENSQDKFFIEKYSEKTPLGRMAKPNDYKGALIYLASDASAYMTGANLVVDGGWTCW
jgi:NAD(P)-dependent dehydrogenase (short-subunit alcohol dehydrogenase family)